MRLGKFKIITTTSVLLILALELITWATIGRDTAVQIATRYFDYSPSAYTDTICVLKMPTDSLNFLPGDQIEKFNPELRRVFEELISSKYAVIRNQVEDSVWSALGLQDTLWVIFGEPGDKYRAKEQHKANFYVWCNNSIPLTTRIWTSLEQGRHGYAYYDQRFLWLFGWIPISEAKSGPY